MNNTSSKSEVELIRELKSGSNQAFDALYNMYFKRLYAYCYQFTKSREDAEEIVQDVFIRLWRIKETIRQEETLKSLLFILSKHLLVDAYHKKVNSVIFEDYVVYNEEGSLNDGLTKLEYDDFVKKIKSSIESLPKTQQKVIELSRFKDMPIKEIAQFLSLSEQTVKNQLSLGIKTIRKLIMFLLFFIKI